MSEQTIEYKSFAIVGLGLIGGSVAKDLRAEYPNAYIAAIDTDKKSIVESIKDGIVDEAIEYKHLPNLAQVTILAPPMDYIRESALCVSDSFAATHKRTFKNYIVLDTASVKTPVAELFEDLTAISQDVEFVATHPMAGTEYSGFKHARKDLFRAKPWIVCSHPNNTPEAIDAVSNFLHGFGAKVRQINAEEHDRQAALVSHSVIMLSNLIFEYIATKHPEALELAGDGFISTTRLASGNPELHKSIIQNNASFTEQHLEEFSEFLAEKVKHLSTDGDLLLDYFKQNMNQRNSWLRRRK